MEEKIAEVKKMIHSQYYKECEALISSLMLDNPHSALPHNLMGILLEKQGRHEDAMRHFRAAYALDPEYEPAERNIENLGGFAMHHECDYGENFQTLQKKATVKEKQ